MNEFRAARPAGSGRRRGVSSPAEAGHDEGRVADCGWFRSARLQPDLLPPQRENERQYEQDDPQRHRPFQRQHDDPADETRARKQCRSRHRRAGWCSAAGWSVRARAAPSLTSSGALARASSSSGAPRSPSRARRSGLNWSRKIWRTCRCDTLIDVEPGLEQLTDAFEGHERLDHEHHLDREVETIVRGATHRRHDQPGERELAEVGVSRDQRRDTSSTSRRKPTMSRAWPRVGDGGEIARGVLRVAGDEAVVVVEQQPPQLVVEAADHAEVDEAASRPGEDRSGCPGAGRRGRSRRDRASG